MPVKLATSIKEVDLSGLKLPVIAIYDHPEDYVARVFDTDRPTDTIILKPTLAAVQEDIRDNTNMVFFARGAEDDKCIVGAWM